MVALAVMPAPIPAQLLAATGAMAVPALRMVTQVVTAAMVVQPVRWQRTLPLDRKV
jgi:hypothetical protein